MNAEPTPYDEYADAVLHAPIATCYRPSFPRSRDVRLVNRRLIALASRPCAFR